MAVFIAGCRYDPVARGYKYCVRFYVPMGWVAKELSGVPWMK